MSNRLLIGGEFTVVDNTVMLGSTVIGKRQSNGWGKNDLLIAFEPGATRLNVQKLLRAIAFKTVGGQAGERLLQFSLSDGDGGESGVVEKVVNVTY